jgi:hypothetical protein
MLFDVGERQCSCLSKANLLLLRVSRTRTTHATLLLVASTNVRVEQLNRKVQFLIGLVKENGGEFPKMKKKKKKKKKTDTSKVQVDVQVCTRRSK